MQVSLSVPSTPQAAQAGTGADALFEDVTGATQGENDAEFVESFDALIQAALLAISASNPPTDSPALSTAVEAAATGERSPGDIASDPRSGTTQTPDATRYVSDAAPRGPVTADLGVGSGMPESAALSAKPADSQGVRQPELDRVVPEGPTNGPMIEPAAGQAAVDQAVGEGETSDDVMIVVEESMESFTPIPASVLALMRADAVTATASKDTITPTGPKGQQPLQAVDDALESGSPNEVESAGDDFLAPIPAVEFVAARGMEAEEFTNRSGALTEDGSESGPPDTPAAASEQSIQTPHAPTSLPMSSAPGDSHHRLPAVTATREAIGAFAIEQIVSRANGRDDEPVSRIEARIDPPELGRMSIEISRTSEGLSAHLTVDDPSVLALLDQQMREVQQTLEAAGVPMTSLTMSAGSERDAPQQDSRRDDEERNLASPARPIRSSGARSTTSRREIDTTA